MPPSTRTKKRNYLAQPRCGNCRHWQRLDDSSQLPAEDVMGECRRYPPTISGREEGTDEPLQDVPLVEAQHWCGEHGMPVN